MYKFLIIGGAGFIGLQLTKKLIKKNIVHIVDNFSRGQLDKELIILKKNKNFRLIEFNFLDFNIKNNSFDKDYDYIINLAAILGVENVLSDPFSVLSNNYLINANFINLGIEQKKLKKALFSSPSEVYADSITLNRAKIPTNENTTISVIDPTTSRTSYFLSKIYGESLIHYSKIPYTIFRPHNIYGGRMGMAHVIPELMKKMYFCNNGEVEVFSPSHTRAFCYIDDAITQIKLLITSNKTINQTFNIGNSNEEIKIKKLSYLIKNIIGSKCKLIFKDAENNSQKRRCPDLNKIQNIQKKNIDFVNLHEGLRKTFNWYKENYFNEK